VFQFPIQPIALVAMVVAIMEGNKEEERLDKRARLEDIALRTLQAKQEIKNKREELLPKAK
jgi:hypothetical protein